MYRNFWKHPLRGGLYHLSLIFVTIASFNWGFASLSGIDIAGRVFAGVEIPWNVIAGGLCFSSVVVLWNNWVD